MIFKGPSGPLLNTPFSLIIYRIMSKLVGKKIKMTQIWKDDKVVPVTLVKLGSEKLEDLKVGGRVKVSGITKGHGFQGVVKRHGFHGGPQTHGQKNRLRAPGSIGSTAPQRVLPGRRMAGRMGGVRFTVKNLQVVDLNTEKKELFLKGAVPGNRNGKVEIRT